MGEPGAHRGDDHDSAHVPTGPSPQYLPAEHVLAEMAKHGGHR